MNPQIPQIHQSVPTQKTPPITTQPLTQHQGATSQPLVSTESHTHDLGPPTRKVRLSDTDEIVIADTSMDSEYDLRIQTTTEHREATTIPFDNTKTSTPHGKNSDQRTLYTTTEKERVPSPPPYDSATYQLTDAQLRKHLDDLVKENARLRKENKKSIEAIQQTTAAQIASLAETVTRLTDNLHTLTSTPRPQSTTTTRESTTADRATFLEPHLPTPSIREFREHEQLQGTKNFKEWAASVHTELQLHEIAETLMSDGAVEAPWPLSTQIRADAVARRIILQSVSPKIRTDLYTCPSTYHMWRLLNRRYMVVSLYSSHQIMTQVENMVLLPTQTAVEFIADMQRLRDEYASVAHDHSEAYWASAVLRKLQQRYKTEAEELMRRPEFTVEDIRTFFAERVYETPATQPTHRTHTVSRRYVFPNQQAASTSTFPYPTGTGSTFPTSSGTVDSYSAGLQTHKYSAAIQTQSGMSTSVVPFPTTAAKHTTQPSSTTPQVPTQKSSGSVRPPRPSSKQYLRAYNPLVPILEGPRTPPPVSAIYSGSRPLAGGNKCIGCGMSGHNTYTCPFGNVPLCYTCKRFGHTSTQCRPEWVQDLPGDSPLSRSYPPIPNTPQPTPPPQLLAIEDRPSTPPTEPTTEEGNVLRVSSLMQLSPPTDVFLLDSGASAHIVRDHTLLTTFLPGKRDKTMYTANGKSSISVLGMGTITLCTQTRDHTHVLNLLDVIVAPQIPVNVISVAKLCADNFVTIQFNDLGALLFRTELIQTPSSPTQTDSCTNISDPASSHSDSLHDSERKLCNQTQRFSFASNSNTQSLQSRSVNFAKPIFYVPRSSDFLFSIKINKHMCTDMSLSNIISSLPSPEIPQNNCRGIFVLIQSTQGVGNSEGQRTAPQREEGKTSDSEGGGEGTEYGTNSKDGIQDEIGVDQEIICKQTSTHTRTTQRSTNVCTMAPSTSPRFATNSEKVPTTSSSSSVSPLDRYVSLL